MTDARKWVAERQADVAEALGVSPTTVKDWAARGMPGTTGDYSIPTIAKWLRTAGPWAPKAKPDDDPLLTPDAGDSPGLERYRLAKAELAEFELAERRGKLIAVDKVRTALGRWATILRNAGERIARNYSNDAATVLNDALKACETVIDHEFGGPESTDDPAAE